MNFVDRSGVVWFGTKGFGIYQYNQKNVSFGLIPSLNLKALSQQFRSFRLPPDEELKKIPSVVRDYFWAYSFVDKYGHLWIEGEGVDNISYMRRYNPKSNSVQIYKNGKIGVTIGCSGSRAYATLTDDEMIMGIPIEFLADVDGNVRLVLGGARQDISPKTHQKFRWHKACRSRQEPAQDGGFARRPEGRTAKAAIF